MTNFFNYHPLSWRHCTSLSSSFIRWTKSPVGNLTVFFSPTCTAVSAAESEAETLWVLSCVTASHRLGSLVNLVSDWRHCVCDIFFLCLLQVDPDSRGFFGHTVFFFLLFKNINILSSCVSGGHDVCGCLGLHLPNKMAQGIYFHLRCVGNMHFIQELKKKSPTKEHLPMKCINRLKCKMTWSRLKVNRDSSL